MKLSFKDDLIIDNIKFIIQDSNFTVKRYWFKKAYLLNLLKNKLKIQSKTAPKILEMYNEYHWKKLWLDEIFIKTEGHLKQDKNLIEFNFSDSDSMEINFKFLERILSMNQNLLSQTFN